MVHKIRLILMTIADKEDFGRAIEKLFGRLIN